MIYLGLAAAAVLFGLYNVFIKLSADHVHAVLGAVVLQFVAAFMGLAVLLWLYRSGTAEIGMTGRGLALSALAGVAIGGVEILTFALYGRGLAVAVGNPLIVGGSLVVTTGVGLVLLREHFNAIQFAAVALIMLGVALLAWQAARPAGVGA